jgi:hypothetical protein
MQLSEIFKELNEKEMRNVLYYYIIKYMGLKNREVINKLLKGYGV